MSDLSEARRLAGKLAVITGAASGIGAACALLFARHGATVIATDLDAVNLASTRSAAQAHGFPLAECVAADLTDEADVARLVEVACARGAGQIDVLVNAGAFAVMRWIEELSLADWRATLAGELDIVFLLCREVWPHMKGRSGAIINFASANAHMALAGSPALAHCAGKGGVLAMTHQLAMEGAPHGIRVNSIAPGLVVTSATASFLADPAVEEAVRQRHMLKRLGTPEDIAAAALFLASDEASWITAAELRVDGGVTRW